MKKEDQIVQTLIEAKEDYYKGIPRMTDEEFDNLEDALRKIDPENPYFSIVGTPDVKGKKITHAVPMLSCQKAKALPDVLKWLNKISDHRIPLVVESKIDGLSMAISYKRGTIDYIATRGYGKVGQDITHIKDYIDIPQTIESLNTIEIRGELYLPKDTTLSNPQATPLRNLAVGLINRKSDRGDLKHLKFVAYQIVNSNNFTEQEDVRQLKLLGFNTVDVELVHSLKQIEEYYNLYLNKLRDAWEYQTDGLVIIVNEKALHKEINSNWVVEHHNHFNLAFKPPSEAKNTKLLGIEWQVSRYGALIPVGILEPVVIGGATISKVSFHNYKTVQENKLREGDIIKIQRANDVIPFYEKTESHSDKELFTIKRCPSCDTLLSYEGVHAVCINQKCPEMNIQKITYWCETCEMDQVAESTIRTLYNENIVTSIHNLYSLKKIGLENLAGFGDKKINNLLEQIEKSKTVSVVQFLNRLGIPSVGEKAIKKLGINSMEDFWNFKNDGSAIGNNLTMYRDSNKQYIDDLIVYLSIQDIKSNSDSLGNVCMTGSGPKGRKELIKDIEALGYSFVDSITKDTNILLCDDLNSGSSKIKKAQKLGVQVILYQEFFK